MGKGSYIGGSTIIYVRQNFKHKKRKKDHSEKNSELLYGDKLFPNKFPNARIISRPGDANENVEMNS